MSRKLDALVAEHVMGWTDMKLNQWVYHGHAPGIPGWSNAPEYSTDIAAAWEVVDKIRLEYVCEVAVVAVTNNDSDPSWLCQITYGGEPEQYSEYAFTAPMAICLAALKAKGVDVE